MLKKGVSLGRVIVLVAVVSGGCASDETLSREQYVSRLDAMCEDFGEKERTIGEPRTLADVVEKGPRILDAFEKSVVDEVRDLKAPGEIADQADRLADLAVQQRDVLRGLIDAAKNNDFAEVRSLVSRNEALNNEARSIARELGAQACARD